MDEKFFSFVREESLNLSFTINMKPTPHSPNLKCFGIMFEDSNGKYYYSGDTNDYKYLNEDTNYSAFIDDNANLLSMEERSKLFEEMLPLTEYGHIAFVFAYFYSPGSSVHFYHFFLRHKPEYCYLGIR